MGKGTDLTKNEREKFGFTRRSGRTPEEIGADIEQTRVGLEGTIDEIKEKFSSEHIKDRVRDATVGRAKRMMKSTGQRAKQMGSTAMESMKTNPVTRTVLDNPIPAALVGIGIGWLIMKGFTRSNGRYETSTEFETEEMDQSSSQPAGEALESIKTSAGETLNRAKDKAGEMADLAKEKVKQLRSEAGVRAQALKEWYQDTLQNRPLVLFGAALVFGLLVGLSIPETRSEHELMGETKDKLLSKAREVAREKAEKVEHLAMEAKESAAEKAREHLVS